MAIGTTAAIIGASVIGAGASLAGGSIQAGAARDAGNLAANSANYAADLQFEQSQQTRQDFEPFRLAGVEALNGDAGIMRLLGLTPQGGGQQAQQQPMQGQPQQGIPDRINPGQRFPGVGGAAGITYGDLNVGQKGMGTADYLNQGNQPQPGPQPVNALGGQELYRQPGGMVLPGADNPQGFTLNPGINPGPGGAPQVGMPAASNGTAYPQGGNPAAGAPAVSPTDVLRATPGYQFRFDEGMRAVNNSLAAAGISNSGAAQRELTRVGQGYADQGYQSQLNNLFNVTNIGTGAAANTASAGSSAAANAGNAILAGGQAQANAATQRGSAYSNALGGVAGAAGWGLGAYGANQGWGGF